MAKTLEMKQCFDFLSHCDDECKNIIVPYINNIERLLLIKHNNSRHYIIPFVIKSICSSYFCQHLEYRLSFKKLFTQYPTHYHFICDLNDRYCHENWKICPSIQRIQFILSNFQYYLNSNILFKQQHLSPYITYKYYQIKQILSDINHINTVHPENMVKFYIRNNIIKNDEALQCDHNYYNNNNDLDINNMEEWIKYNVFNIHKEYIDESNTKKQFECSISHIITYNATENVFSLLNVLRNVSKKLILNDIKYRTLDTKNILVQQKLMGFEGVLNFLSLLGFESNAIGTKLICQYPPSIKTIKNAISVIDSYNPQNPSQINPIINNYNGNRNGIKQRQTEQKQNHIMVHIMNTRMTVNPLSVSQDEISHIQRNKKSIFESMELKKSETDYIDIGREIAISMDLKENNDPTSDTNNGGIMNWFGQKLKRIKQNY